MKKLWSKLNRNNLHSFAFWTLTVGSIIHLITGDYSTALIISAVAMVSTQVNALADQVDELKEEN